MLAMEADSLHGSGDPRVDLGHVYSPNDINTAASMNESLSTGVLGFSDFPPTYFGELFSRTLEHLFEVPPSWGPS